VIQLAGLHVYPGMIDADTVVGLMEIESVRGSLDINETGPVNPDARVEIALNPDSELIPVTRVNGITHVLAVPGGGLISGTSVLERLDGWTWEDLAAAAPAALHVQYPRWRPRPSFFGPPVSKEDLKKEREKALQDLRETFAAARAYRQARGSEGAGGRRPRNDPALEAMIPVLEGKIPVMVHAGEIRQIKDALRWAKEEKIRMILVSGADAGLAAGLLKEQNVPVVLGPILETPDRRDEPYDTPFTVAAKLLSAGVPFCISGGGGAFNAPVTRNLPYHAAMAAAFGLPKDEALKAITLYPARILGVEKDLGSIEAGKSASLIVTDGDPLEIRTQIKRVFIDGRPADLMNRHLRLYEKYSGRPKAVEKTGK
jgi:imidazolonepropionase-like amidohydrolase